MALNSAGVGPIDALFKASARGTGVEAKAGDDPARAVPQGIEAPREPRGGVELQGKRGRARAGGGTPPPGVGGRALGRGGGGGGRGGEGEKTPPRPIAVGRRSSTRRRV